MATESQLKILAVAPSLARLLGHDYGYHQSLYDGFSKRGIDYTVLCPTKIEFTKPAHCIPCLIHFKTGETLFRKIWSRLLNFFLLFMVLSNQFSKRIKSAAPSSPQVQTVLFIESFKNSELLAFLLSSLFFGKEASIVVLLRHEPALYRFKGRILIPLLKGMLKIKRPDHFKILCDSAIVQKSFINKLPTTLHVLPIPHTFISKKNIGTLSYPLKCWWPGNPIRQKGLKIIQKLVTSILKQKLILVLSEATPFIDGPIDKNITLKKIPAVLSREEYMQHMLAADFILLPYDPVQYRTSTSGIFVEGVMSGAIPLVSAGTWMAEELKIHHLPELISDFNMPDLSETIYSIAQQHDVMERLNKMRKMYQEFHNSDSFARLFQSVVAN